MTQSVDASTKPKDMESIVSLCKRRGFLFQSSEIYGGLQGFWDYGPLGVELKRNVKDAWWQDMVSGHDDMNTLPVRRHRTRWKAWTARSSCIPQVWKCSGHYDLFHDFMVDCRESKKRYRHDQLNGRWVEAKDQKDFRHGDRPATMNRPCRQTGAQVFQPAQQKH